MSELDTRLVVGDAPDLGGNDCGCCGDAAGNAPAAIFNRPGLSAIAYRIATHARFNEAMRAQLSSAALPALAALRTRDDDDYTIALLDAWATVADVLTFYQERIANESYLRTATERLSVLELAALIGYRARPGVAAGARLAFALEESAGAPDQAVAVTRIARGTRVQSVPGPGEQAQIFETVEDIDGRVAWNALKPRLQAPVANPFTKPFLYLAGTATNLKPGDAVLLVGDERINDTGSGLWDFRRVKTVEEDQAARRTRITWQADVGSLDPSKLPAKNPRVYALRLRAALFGYNAPHPRSLHKDIRINYDDDIGDATPPPDWSYSFSGNAIDLDNAYPGIANQGWLVLSNANGTRRLYRASSAYPAAGARYALSGKTTHVVPDITTTLGEFAGTSYRGTAVFAQSEELALAEAPVADAVAGNSVVLDRAVAGLVPGQVVIVRGKRARVKGPAAEADETVAEIAILKSVALEDPRHSRLTFAAALANAYDRGSTEILGNVARATHGESVSEILGSGDARRGYQRFTLKQPPLTHVSAASASGIESTLQVRVGDVLWHEVPALFGRGPQERVFTTRTADDGKTTIQFGDGRSGARLPSGQDNIRAAYRKGIGLGGLVGAGKLSMLITQPLGVKSVINPLSATGAADPESLDDARINAPIPVLTLDRAVSLGDYEDFARGFAGVAKALATWSWDGQTRRVFITVAGPGGAEIKPDSDLYKNLVAALGAAGDPFVTFAVKTFRPALFRVGLKVKVHADHLAEIVLPAVDAALRQRFAFDGRGFGQKVVSSEVIAIAQDVAGVVAIDLDRLYRVTPPADSPGLHPRLLAALPEIGVDGEMIAAELLTLDPAPFDSLEVMS